MTEVPEVIERLDAILNALDHIGMAQLELVDVIVGIAGDTAWLARGRPHGARQWGRYYGYPDCCVEGFIADTEDQRSPAQLRPLHPTYGYVMCEACAADPERRDRMAAESWAHRQASLWELHERDGE